MRRIAVLAVVAAVVTACSSDRGDDPTASGGGGDTAGDSSDSGGGGGGGNDGEAMFGDLESPCGEAEEGGEAASGGDPGVSADQITIGYGDDAGFPNSPGLNHEAADAIEAMIAWCNEQGGINGREIVGNYYDAAITEVTNAVTQACTDEVFMLVGTAWALDSAQEEARLGCDLPMVPTYTVSAEAANAPLMYQAVPNPVDRWTVSGAAQLAELFPDEVQNAAVMFGNFSATIDTKDKALEAFPAAGWEFLDCPQEYNLQGETDWRPFVAQLEDCGVEAVYFSGSPYPNMQNLLDAAAQEGYEPLWLVETNSYIRSFAEWNQSGNGDNVYIRTVYTPFEQAEDNEATQQYIDIVEGNDGDIAQLGQQATSSFLLWATAADACGADLSRDCVMEELSQVTSWTGGGMHAETNPGENLPPQCGMLLKLDGTEFVQAAPDEQGEFECSEDFVQEVSGRVVDQAQLNDDRVSTRYR